MNNGTHGASDEGQLVPTQGAAEPEPEVPDSVPMAAEGAAMLLSALPVPGVAVHGEEPDDV